MSEPEQKAELDSKATVNGSSPPNNIGTETTSVKKDELNGALGVQDGGKEQKEEKEEVVDDVKMADADDANITEGMDSKMAEADNLKKKEDKETEKEGDEDVREEEAVDRNEEEAEDMQKEETEDVKKVEAKDTIEEIDIVKDVEMGDNEVEGEKMEEDKIIRKEGNGNTEKKNEEKAELSKKKRVRGQKVSEKGEAKKKKEGETKAKEVSTPVASSIERPVRERKSVERLVEALERESVKPFIVEKGRGTALNDIPNVAYKLAKKKPADLRLLHQMLFGRVGKASSYKNHILQFSGFVWHESEDKKKTKIKEKLDKCVKDRLIGFCDLFDFPVSRAHARKEELVATLLDFMVAPHATRDVILSEKEQQSSKSKKRKRVGRGSGSNSSGRLSEKRPRKENTISNDTLTYKGEESAHETEDKEEDNNENGVPPEDDTTQQSEDKEKDNESKEEEKEEETEEEKEEKDINGNEDHDLGKGRKEMKSPRRGKKPKVPSSPKKISSPKSAKSRMKPSSSKHSKTEDSLQKNEYEEDEAKDVKGGDDDADHSAKGRKEIKSPKSGGPVGVKRSKVPASTKKISTPKSVKSATKKVSTPKSVKSATEPSSSKHSKTADKSNGSGKVFSRKKKNVETPKQKAVVYKTNAKEKEKPSGKKLAKGKAKSKEPDESGPSKEELRKIICEILNKVDFNTATFTDIFRELASHFGVDLSPRKASIKLMIQEELTKLAEADEGDEDDEDEDETEDDDE